MKNVVLKFNNLPPPYLRRIKLLQRQFISMANNIALVASHNHCWNRVALHQMVYYSMRARYPGLGSQMTCNAIYAVCRAFRYLFQHPASSIKLSNLKNEKLPKVVFLDHSPVFFDLHTMSFKENYLSVFTPEGRLKFPLNLDPSELKLIQSKKIKEIKMLSYKNTVEFQIIFAENVAKNGMMSELSIDNPSHYLFVRNKQKFINLPLVA
jgi:hypothetical protein